jgi:hypothetical protein
MHVSSMPACRHASNMPANSLQLASNRHVSNVHASNRRESQQHSSSTEICSKPEHRTTARGGE